MVQVRVDKLLFTFTSGVAAQNYDQWQHYTTVWNAHGNRKAVDVVAVQNHGAKATARLIEAKDYRIITNPPKPCNLAGLAQTMADKVRDTRAGLNDASTKAVHASEKQLAAAAVQTPKTNVVLHLEPHRGIHSKLFPTNFSANVLQKLRQLLNASNSKPAVILVLRISNTAQAGVPWTVR